MRFVILHHHILKNAGSTIEEILDRSFGERFARLDSADRDHVITGEALAEFVVGRPRLMAVSSHQIRYPMPGVRDILFFDICFLRDPLERVRSMYDYFRKRPAEGDPVSQLANSLDLGPFVAAMIERYPLQIRNVQVNLLAAAGDSDEPDGEHLRIATERILRASFPGVVDLFAESVRAGEYFLRQVFPELDGAPAPVNVSGQLEGGAAGAGVSLKEACTPAVYEELVRLNALDLQLVERARAEVRRRVALVPAREAAWLAPSGAGGFIQRLVSGVRLWRLGLFDGEFYLKKYSDVAAAGANPFLHYVRYGAVEGRKPHALVDPARKDSPHRLFDIDGYVETYPSAAKLPIAHFVARKNTKCYTSAIIIDDVELALVLLAKPVLVEGSAVGIAMVWPDPGGGMRFLAPPEQGRFFQSLNYDQLKVQLQYSK